MDIFTVTFATFIENGPDTLSNPVLINFLTVVGQMFSCICLSIEFQANTPML